MRTDSRAVSTSISRSPTCVTTAGSRPATVGMRASWGSHCPGVVPSSRASAPRKPWRAVVGEQSALHRVLCLLLQAAVDGGVHDVAVDIGLVAIAGDHLGARHFRGVLGMQIDARAVLACATAAASAASCAARSM